MDAIAKQRKRDRKWQTLLGAHDSLKELLQRTQPLNSVRPAWDEGQAGQLHGVVVDRSLLERLLEKNRQSDICAIFSLDAISKKKEWGDNDDVRLRQQGLSWDEIDRSP